jgi:RHS repeat-associated protein
VTGSYDYDAERRRIRTVTSTGETVIFVYDLEGQLLGEYDQAGKALREYVWLDNIPVAMFMPDPANASNPPQVFYIHADHLNAPRIVVDQNGAKRWRWLAEPFGTTAPEANPDGLGAFTQNLRFPGQYADAESGLWYNYFRNYDSSKGGYTQSDPTGLAGGINTFIYVEGNPLLLVDPNGLSTLGDAGALLVGWGGRVGGAALGEALFPLGGGVPGAIIGGRLGSWGGRAAGEWLNGLITASETKTPNSGPPGSCHENPGSGQERLYGDDGLPLVDLDYDHFHDGDKPHAHNWDRTSDGRPKREFGGPFSPWPKGRKQGF